MLSAAVCEEWLLGSLFGHPDFLTLLENEGISENDFVTDWGKKMFSVISATAKTSQILDLFSLGDKITSEEMGRLASVITRDGSFVNTREQFLELVASLRSEKNKQAMSGENLKQMDDAELSALIEKLKADKK